MAGHPASFHWDGPKLSAPIGHPSSVSIVDQMIEAINSAAPDVFAIMDYWTFDGWFALQKRIKQHGAPKLRKVVFPGIELRVAAPIPGRLNLHAVFSNEIADQVLLDFLGTLTLELIDQPLSSSSLINYARNAGADKLMKHGFAKDEVMNDERVALNAGQKIAELKVESYKLALSRAPKDLALGFVPFNTNDGVGTIKWHEHYAYAMSLFQGAPIFEARDDPTWNAFVGTRTQANSNWFENFQAALGQVPRLPVSGSDAHRFIGDSVDNNKRGYGDYPSGRATWIKADPTWHGLLQAIKEPAQRCFIGDIPPKLNTIRNNKTFYIDNVSIRKVQDSKLTAQWFDGCKIPLSPHLVAIIGNKESGKSALADIIALAGNSRDNQHFSFLKRARFRGKSGEPANEFIGRIEWLAGEPCERNLADDPVREQVELVRYIPQGRFDELCNAHVTGKSKEFEAELRAVVFDHLGPETRLGAHTFDRLVEDQENIFRSQLNDARTRLGDINRRIVTMETELQPEMSAQLVDFLLLKQRQLAELNNEKPAEVAQPSEKLSQNQEEAAKRIAGANKAIGLLDESKGKMSERQRANTVRKRALASATDKIALFASQFKAFERELSVELDKVPLAFHDIVQLTIDSSKILVLQKEVGEQEAEMQQTQAQNTVAVLAQNEIITVATSELNGPQQAYQAFQVKLADWKAKVAALQGSSEFPEPIEGLTARLKLLGELPERLREHQEQRKAISSEIVNILIAQRTARERLFDPLQEAIAENALIGSEYELQFKANLQTFADLIWEPLFSIVKHNVGEIRGEDESFNAIKNRLDLHDVNSLDGAVNFATAVHDLLHESARNIKSTTTDLGPLLRKERSAVEVYNFIFGFEYLSPQYTLLFQQMPIEQLSPGQRGALLLIFYLLVDKGRNPIILDQPEENLDNETVVELLVPVLLYAKELRQIVMVTHNPNLAVVCDAEQIIMARFERKAGSRILYESGSIEAPSINACVVTVLEGTKKAFDNRGGKYH